MNAWAKHREEQEKRAALIAYWNSHSESEKARLMILFSEMNLAPVETQSTPENNCVSYDFGLSRRGQILDLK